MNQQLHQGRTYPPGRRGQPARRCAR
jgi:hypothetical protein